MSRNIKRGQIWIAELGSPNGSEQRGTRPVLVIQNNLGNANSPTVIVAAMTHADKKYMPTHVPIKASSIGVKKDSVVLLEQIRTIDKSLLKEKVCTVSGDVMVKVNYAMKVSLGLVPVPVSEVAK